MQPTESFGVSRRALDVEDYIDILRRHKGWILGPFLLTLVASVVGVYMWPDSYQSEAAIKIVPQQLPQNFVPQVINQEMLDRINSMSQTIRSRTVLTTIINTFGLYPRERARYPIEDVIEMMNRKIDIAPVASIGGSGRSIPAFVVRFTYENRYAAQRVVGDLVSRFIEEYNRTRSNATYQTTEFLRDQMTMAKKDLDEVESRLTAFRMENAGHLPDQVNSNMQQLQALQANVTYLANAISRSQQDKLQLESQVRIFKDNMAQLTKEPADATTQIKNERLADAEREIQNWENTLNNLRKDYKDTFPDVQIAKNRLAAARERRDAILKEDAQAKKDSPTPARTISPQQQRELRDLDTRIRQMESAVQAKDVEIGDLNAQMKRANDQIKNLQGRLETVPVGERQFGDLLRERDMAKSKYMDLEDKLGKAEIAKDMEGRKQGETLELLDPASLPMTPTEPKRGLVIGVGAGLGLVLGLVIAGALEVKDTSLKNLKDVRAYTQMAILGSIPLLENDFVVRRRKRLAWLGWTTACLFAAVTMAGSVVYYYVTRV